MALSVRCSKHNIEYIVGNIYPTWWIEANIPACPLCRREWMEEHKETWDLPVHYEIMLATADWEVVNCLGLHN